MCIGGCRPALRVVDQGLMAHVLLSGSTLSRVSLTPLESHFTLMNFKHNMNTVELYLQSAQS